MAITPFQFQWDEIRLYSFALFFIVAGIGHLVKPKMFAAIIPFLPYKYAIVYFTGLVEIALAIGLLFDEYRVVLVWLTIIYLVAIFPGNIYMALNPDEYPFSKKSLYVRLPFQLLFIWWVYSLESI